MQFDDVYVNYLKYAEKQMKESTFAILKRIFKLHIIPYFKNKSIEDITIDDILKWQDYILQKKYKNQTNENIYYCLSGFFRYCNLFCGLKNNVVQQVGCFKKQYEPINYDYYTIEEFEIFVQYVDNVIYKYFFYFMFYCGTRPGEAMALKFSDIKENMVSINKTIQSHDGRKVTPPKTPTSFRTIRINKNILKKINELYKFYKTKYNLTNFDYYVFGGIKPLAPTTITRYKNKACQKANLRPITLHQFRHSHATLLLKNGVLIHEISRRLGHSKVSTTLDIYTHSDFYQEKRVLNTLDTIRLKSLLNPTRFIKKLINLLKQH